MIEKWTKQLVVSAVAAALLLGASTSAVRADAVTDENVDTAVASAKTVADHQALAAYFTAKSDEALANVKTHERMAGVIRGKGGQTWEAHCQSLIKTYNAQAKDYAALAKEQSAFATGMEHGK